MSTIHELAQIDLNLLVAFDVLVREQSVTRAASRLGVTQSAMSHTLRRLRDVLDDPLLVRSGMGMVNTPRAEALAIPIRASLEGLGRALTAPPAFLPATARRSFRLAAPDLFSAIVLPSLLQHLRDHAPGVDVDIMGTGIPEIAASLETGELDLVVQAVPSSGPPVPNLPTPGLVRKILFRDAFACFMRHDHPYACTAEPTLREYATLPHVLVSPSGRGGGPVDPVLMSQGHRRRVALRAAHFSTALLALAHSDLILTAPSALGRIVDDRIVMRPLPPMDLPGFAVALAWHERWAADPAHRWFRNLLGTLASAVQRSD